MSQHDMVVSTGSGATVRADINAALQALASSSKGPSAPATPYSGQLWLDDNTPSGTVWTLYIYDGSDWVSIGTIDSVSNQFAASAQNGVPTGAMVDFAGTSAPTGYLLCDGSNVSRTTYAALFAAIGTTWGAGDGSTTFGLPDFRRRVAVGSGGSGSGTLGNSVGNTGGAETHTLTTGEIPAHAHGVTDPGHTHGLPNVYSSNAGGTLITTSTPAVSLQTATDAAVTGISIQNAGGGGAHNNLQPSAIVLKVIKT